MKVFFLVLSRRSLTQHSQLTGNRHTVSPLEPVREYNSRYPNCWCLTAHNPYISIAGAHTGMTRWCKVAQTGRMVYINIAPHHEPVLHRHVCAERLPSEMARQLDHDLS
jgi:hypothetical protein